MKMSDVFNGEIVTKDHGGNLLSISDDKGKFCLVNVHCAEHVALAIKSHDKLAYSLASILSIHDGECRFVRGCCQEHLDLTGDGKCHVGDAKRLLKELGHEI